MHISPFSTSKDKNNLYTIRIEYLGEYLGGGEVGEDLCVDPSLALSFLGLYRGMSPYPRAPSLIPGVPWALGSRDDHARAPPGRYLERYCVHVGTLLCTRVYTLVYTRVYFSLLGSRDMSAKHTSRVQLLPHSVYTPRRLRAYPPANSRASPREGGANG